MMASNRARQASQVSPGMAPPSNSGASRAVRREALMIGDFGESGGGESGGDFEEGTGGRGRSRAPLHPPPFAPDEKVLPPFPFLADIYCSFGLSVLILMRCGHAGRSPGRCLQKPPPSRSNVRLKICGSAMISAVPNF